MCSLYSLIFFLLFPLVSSLNILFYYAVVGPSHIYFLNTAVKLLVDRGHTVDVVFAVYNELVDIKHPPNVRRVYYNRHTDPDYWKKNAMHFSNMFEKSPTPWGEFEIFHESGYQLCRNAMVDHELEEFISTGNYSIGLTSDYDPCGNIMITAAGIPATGSYISTPLFLPHKVSAGLPSVASVYGTTLYPEHDGSFYDKLFNFLRLTHYHYFFAPSLEKKYNQLIRKKFGTNFPDVAKIERDVDVIFVNSNEFLEKQRPLSQKIKYIGGMGVKKAKKLPEEFDNLLSTPASAFVLFSFGTQVPTVKKPFQVRKNFVEAFKKFPNVTFLWKYDSLELDAELFQDVPNVHRLQWLPQTELLHDERVKLFISHMGLNSYLETASAGVPVLSIPLFADQQNNAQNARDREMGLLLDRDKLTVPSIETALRELLGNPKYLKNAKAIAKMMKESPEIHEDIFVKWVEFTAANPGLHRIFALPGAELSPFFYYCGDIVLFGVLIVLDEVPSAALEMPDRLLAFVECFSIEDSTNSEHQDLYSETLDRMIAFRSNAIPFYENLNGLPVYRSANNQNQVREVSIREARTSTRGALYRVGFRSSQGDYVKAFPNTFGLDAFGRTDLSVITICEYSRDWASSTHNRMVSNHNYLLVGDVIQVFGLIQVASRDKCPQTIATGYKRISRRCVKNVQCVCYKPNKKTKLYNVLSTAPTDETGPDRWVITGKEHPVNSRPIELNFPTNFANFPPPFTGEPAILSQLKSCENDVLLVNADVFLPVMEPQRWPCGFEKKVFGEHGDLVTEFLREVHNTRQALHVFINFPPVLLQFRSPYSGGSPRAVPRPCATIEEIIESQNNALINKMARSIIGALDVAEANKYVSHDNHLYPAVVDRWTEDIRTNSLNLTLTLPNPRFREYPGDTPLNILMDLDSTVCGSVGNYKYTGDSAIVNVTISNSQIKNLHELKTGADGWETSLYAQIVSRLESIMHSSHRTVFVQQSSSGAPPMSRLFKNQEHTEEFLIHSLFGIPPPTRSMNQPRTLGSFANHEEVQHIRSLLQSLGCPFTPTEPQMTTIAAALYAAEKLIVVEAPAGGGKTTTLAISALAYAVEHKKKDEFVAVLTSSNTTVAAIVDAFVNLQIRPNHSIRVLRYTSEGAMKKGGRGDIKTPFDSTLVFPRVIKLIVSRTLSGSYTPQDYTDVMMLYRAFLIVNKWNRESEDLSNFEPVAIPSRIDLTPCIRSVNEEACEQRGTEVIGSEELKQWIVKVGFYFFSPNIVIGTNTMCDLLNSDDVIVWNPSLVLYDEANCESKYTLYRSLNVFTRGCRAMLYGDYYQLIHYSRDTVLCTKLENSIWGLGFLNPRITHTTTFGCQSEVAELLSYFFYEGTVNYDNHRVTRFVPVPHTNRSFITFNTYHGLQITSDSTEGKLSNKEEAVLVVNFVDRLLQPGSGVNPTDILVVTFYRKQMELLSELLCHHKEVRVMTVKMSSGVRAEVTLLSMVRTFPRQLSITEDVRMKLVGLSRSRGHTIVFADERYLANASDWKEVRSLCSIPE